MQTKMTEQEKIEVVYAFLRRHPGVSFGVDSIRDATGVTKSYVDRHRALSERADVQRDEPNESRIRWTYIG